MQELNRETVDRYTRRLQEIHSGPGAPHQAGILPVAGYEDDTNERILLVVLYTAASPVAESLQLDDNDPMWHHKLWVDDDHEADNTGQQVRHPREMFALYVFTPDGTPQYIRSAAVVPGYFLAELDRSCPVVVLDHLTPFLIGVSLEDGTKGTVALTKAILQYEAAHTRYACLYLADVDPTEADGETEQPLLVSGQQGSWYAARCGCVYRSLIRRLTYVGKAMQVVAISLGHIRSI